MRSGSPGGTARARSATTVPSMRAATAVQSAPVSGIARCGLPIEIMRSCTSAAPRRQRLAGQRRPRRRRADERHLRARFRAPAPARRPARRGRPPHGAPARAPPAHRAWRRAPDGSSVPVRPSSAGGDEDARVGGIDERGRHRPAVVQPRLEARRHRPAAARCATRRARGIPAGSATLAPPPRRSRPHRRPPPARRGPRRWQSTRMPVFSLNMRDTPGPSGSCDIALLDREDPDRRREVAAVARIIDGRRAPPRPARRGSRRRRPRARSGAPSSPSKATRCRRPCRRAGGHRGPGCRAPRRGSGRVRPRPAGRSSHRKNSPFEVPPRMKLARTPVWMRSDAGLVGHLSLSATPLRR